ncbi:MAG: DUF5329 family protein [Planctomycetes bacterium]|nr:DUF5329 family protein [Planctomycetota bacterium]
MTGGATDRCFYRAAMLLLAVLLAVSIVFMWRATVLMGKIDAALELLASDVTQVTSTAADVSRQVDGILERLDGLEGKAEEAFRLDEVENILDEVSVMTGDTAKGNVRSNPAAQKEIAHLLAFVAGCGHVFEYSGKHKTASGMYVKLCAKYKFYGKSLVSAEDFIAKAASKTIAGNTYYVVKSDGSKVELGDWLSGELERYRGAGTGR